MDRVIVYGVTEAQARAVYARARGIKEAAAALGVGEVLVARWARELGVMVLPYRMPRRPEDQRFSDAECLRAVLSERSLARGACDLDVTLPALHRRARYLGLPTDPAGRAAYRAAHAEKAVA